MQLSLSLKKSVIRSSSQLLPVYLCTLWHNLNTIKELMTNTTTASKYITKRTRIYINSISRFLLVKVTAQCLHLQC